MNWVAYNATVIGHRRYSDGAGNWNVTLSRAYVFSDDSPCVIAEYGAECEGNGFLFAKAHCRAWAGVKKKKLRVMVKP